MTSQQRRILLVCSGNTCRSPLAAALLSARLASTAELAGVIVESAGTAAHQGMQASQGSAAVARERGLDLSAHEARMLTTAMVRDADVILTMGAAHLDQVVALGGRDKGHLLTSYAGEAHSDVADPFGRGITAYRDTADQLDRLLASAALRLQREWTA
jgi:protein-tyrosine-phosphatase